MPNAPFRSIYCDTAYYLFIYRNKYFRNICSQFDITGYATRVNASITLALPINFFADASIIRSDVPFMILQL